MSTHDIDSLFLLAAELAQLTGSRRVGNQIRWLSQNGWRYATDLDGKPRVAREYFRSRLGAVVSAKEQGTNTSTIAPRWDALLAQPHHSTH